MSEIASARINTFGSTPSKADSVQPSEEQIFVLTSTQLQEIITRAIQPLQDRIESLEGIVKHQEDNQFIQLQLIGQLREATKKEPQSMQRDRGDILRALLAANGGKMLAKDARQKMHLGKEQFSLLVSKMSEYIETKPLHIDNRKKVLILRTS
jgi:hypothetical protein